MAQVVEVAFPIPLDQTFTYLLPEDFADVQVGQRVLAPFGRRRLTGYVVDLPAQAGEMELKSIEAVLGSETILTPELLSLAREMASKYGVTLGETLQTILPPGISKESRRVARVTGQEGEPVEEGARQLWMRIREKETLDITSLVRKEPTSATQLKQLEREGWIEISMVLRSERTKGLRTRNPVGAVDPLPKAEPVKLTDDQAIALTAITSAVDEGKAKAFLLHGVTGSGKTEVYLQAAAHTLSLGRTVLALVPEISLTPQFVQRFESRFPGRVAILHSGRTDSERLMAWRKIQVEQADVIIGARSALFAPLRNIGLLILDEEHDPSYKQDSGVLYHAGDLAWQRARKENAVLVRGSATPVMESVQAAKDGEMILLRLPDRVMGATMPIVDIVDLRKEISPFGTKGVLSEQLREALAETLIKSEQAILFLNRRGFAPVVICPSCGETLRCDSCSVALTLHRSQRQYVCHYCAAGIPSDSPCGKCQQPKLLALGIGTEKVEEELKFLFPDARIERMDRDTTQKRGHYETLFRSLQRKEIDILIGTQMVTKGLDLPDVTLVGVLLADQALHLPDFRAAERTFQLLTQVVGRSGRGERAGRAILQTFQPEHYAIQAAAAQDFDSFAAKELLFREELKYPPFSSIALMELRGKRLEDVQKAAQWLARQAKETATKRDIMILGPAPAPVARVADEYRFHLILKGPKGRAAAELGKWLALQGGPRLESVGVKIRLDVDPQRFI